MKLRRLGSEKEESGPFDGNQMIRTVVVGVKLDPPSRELLTWALVKVAQPGDRVIALHILPNTEVLDQNGKSSLLSLVKAFESVLSVYEGFCNLKQIDLKLKICRGTAIRKILVQEAKSFTATTIIVGTTRNHRALGLSTSTAKYCAKKLPLDCSVLAVNNGKVVFQRKSTPAVALKESRNDANNRYRPTSLLSVFHRTLSKNCTASNSRALALPWTVEDSSGKSGNQEACHDQGSKSNCGGITIDKNSSHGLKSASRKCSVCATDSVSSSKEGGNDSLALVPAKTVDAGSTTVSLMMRQLPELKPGWPLLRQTILPERQTLDRSKVRQISVVQWALRLPTRHSTAAIHPDHKPMNAGGMTATTMGTVGDRPNLDGESGAIVLVGNTASPPADDGGSEILPKELESLQEKYSSMCRLFSYRELLLATSNFSSDMLIGKGGSSQVYKGCLPDGKELAVKILKSSEDMLKEFVLEIEIITTLHHKNIISLFGFCYEKNKLILVYDFLPKGSLEENLHGKKDHVVLSWDERYKIAINVAEALDYLHSRSAQSVIHRDVKSSNILLADDFEPQLSDFGLATWASMSSSHITCRDVAGTFGYLAPEYFMYGKVNEKIDVYSFGVVLLELLSGRKPINNEYPKGQESLVMWAKPILQSEKVMQLLDPSLGDTYDNDQMEKMVMAASLCIRREPRFRPRMGLILKLLQGDDEVTKWARSQVNTSEVFDEMDDEAYSALNIQSHLNLALLDVDEDALSVSSIEQGINYITANKSLEDYLRGRWSRSSSLD
ncbi:protein kinase STUNTED isoform X2 [Magnolia sinica]|uniref:protein kinase STUNTED isoform X2 n=1 Tax=Magnolia sinica TaxID=86752 RepID=UPI0026587D32|nr:protein kinase STUNTED isoform X2 [Magnolia sinica]